MHTYLHRQRAGRWLAIPISISVALLLAGAFVGWLLLLTIVPVLLATWLFGSLTIAVADGELRWRFGPGWPRGRVPLTDIADARPVTTSWIDGWGIHFTRFGTLYNVAGFRAVALQLRNGRRLALGTDEPERLLTALGRTPAAR